LGTARLTLRGSTRRSNGEWSFEGRAEIGNAVAGLRGVIVTLHNDDIQQAIQIASEGSVDTLVIGNEVFDSASDDSRATSSVNHSEFLRAIDYPQGSMWGFVNESGWPSA